MPKNENLWKCIIVPWVVYWMLAKYNYYSLRCRNFIFILTYKTLSYRFAYIFKGALFSFTIIINKLFWHITFRGNLKFFHHKGLLKWLIIYQVLKILVWRYWWIYLLDYDWTVMKENRLLWYFLFWILNVTCRHSWHWLVWNT